MAFVLNIALAAACALVLLECAIFARHLSHLRPLVAMSPPEPAEWPKVSVVIAARDEAESAGAAISSRLADDYPDLEIVFVDDRSTDGTADAVRKAAADDPRLRIERVDDLPGGWLGKVHALDRGTRIASGEWLLFSDADVRVERGALRRAVAYCISEGTDLMALVPEYDTGSFAMDAIWASFMRALALMVDPDKVRNPDSGNIIGSGAFNLVRREAFERTPGFEHIRLETADDVALAKMVKHAGGRVEMINGRGLARVAVYRSTREYLHGVEKNGSSLAHRPFVLLAAGFAALLLVEYAPIAATALGIAGLAPWWIGVAGSAALLASTWANCASLWINTRTWLPGLAWPFGVAMTALGVTRSTWLAHRRGGVIWRGTFYPLDALRTGRRVTL